MIIKILDLYPNLKMVYHSLLDQEKPRFEMFLLDQFTIEKKRLDQIPNNKYLIPDCRSQTSHYQIMK